MKIAASIFSLLLAFFMSTGLMAQPVNGQAAEGVLGQTDFISPLSGLSASKFNGPNGVFYHNATGKLYVADRGNHRVLRWNSVNAYINGSDAEAVFGQPDFTTGTSGLAANKMNNPISVLVDNNGSLWVSEYTNNRVLRFDSAATKLSGANADGVLGQPDFITGTGATTQDKLNGPAGIFMDGNGTLWVSNFNNHRVTKYLNAASKPNGAPADGVLGQPDFITSTSGLSATKMNNANGVYMDAQGRLWVSEFTNRRVLRFDDAANKPNGAAADAVLGQPDFTTNTSNTTQNGFGNVRYVTGDANGNLYVVQESNNRLFIFLNAATLPNGANADIVLGQPDFLTGTGLNPPTENSLRTPRAAFVDNVAGKLWVADWANNRLLRYNVSGIIPVELTSLSCIQVPEGIQINWSTASEINNYGFEVQKRTGNQEFSAIGFVNGNGSTTEIRNYSFTDKNLSEGKVWYRLKQIDYDGSYKFSNEISAESAGLINDFVLYGNYPNPFNPSTTISFSSKVKENVKVTVLNLLGEEVATLFEGIANPGLNNFTWDGKNSAGITVNSGIYIYRIAAGAKSFAGKMIMNK
ncbi:MAG: T9SS type A sorting domain-containing protein [Ignavibacteriaceae bacterium]|nr:T9SS type A sorting domain-containing protein [Ignavibacteriaceae bacterium]